MVDTYTVSPDNLTYTFTLRDGLKWHDGSLTVKRLASSALMPSTKVISFWPSESRALQRLIEDRAAAVRPRQAVLERALHDAQAGRRDRPEPADLGLHRV
jgi:hypothetical protein